MTHPQPPHAAASEPVSTTGGNGAADRGSRLDGSPEEAWRIHIRKVDAALAQQDVAAARQAWRDAYLAALGSRCWSGLAEVGDASLRIGAVSRLPQAAECLARGMYLRALFRARQQNSLDGVLRLAEALDALGDSGAVEECLRLAERLAATTRDARARDLVRAFQERSAVRFTWMDSRPSHGHLDGNERGRGNQ